ncbi:MAG: hypothetical protein ACRDMH_12315 [Solirubrobacterales bacterium]
MTKRLIIALAAVMASVAATAYASVDQYSGRGVVTQEGKFGFQAVVHRGVPVKVRRFKWRTPVLCGKGTHQSIHRVHGRFRFGLEVRNREGVRRFWGRAANGKGMHTHVRGYFIPGDPSEHRYDARGLFELRGNLKPRLKHCRTAVHWRASLRE